MYPNVDWTDEMEAAADAAWAPLMEDGDLLERRARRSSSHRTNSHRSGTRKKGTRRTSTKPRAKRIKLPKVKMPRIKLPKVKTASLSTDIQGAKGRIVTNISGRADLLEVMAIRLAELRRDFSQILYNEEQHPRDNHGRYIGGNGAVGVNLHRRIQNGLAYIQDQIVRNIPWHQAMWNGRHGLDTIMNHVQELEANRTAIAQGLEARDIVELQALYHQYQVTSQLADSTHPPTAFDAQEAQRRQEIMQTIAGFLAEREKKTGNTVSLDAAATARAFASLPHQLRTSLEQQVGYLDPAMKALAGQRLHAHLSNAELAYPAERPANQDLQGQTMPFIAATVVDAFLHGELAGDQGNMNETRFATINGQRYAIKTLLPNPVRPGKVDGARNEAATVAIAKAAGLESVVPTQTYHVQGTDGKQYSVATFMLGEANQQNMPAIAPLVSPESVQQSLVLQHLMLLDDRRPPNALVDIQGHTLTEIDNEFAFWHAADPRNSYSYQILRAQNPSAVMPLIDRSVVQSVVDRQAQIEQTLQRLPLTPDERYLVGTRLDTMKWALLTGKPLTMYLLMTPQYQQRANVPDAITSLRFRLADLQRANPNRDSHGRFTAGAGHADLTTYHAKVTSLGTKYHEAHATHPTVAKAHAALLKAIEKAGTPPPVDFDGLIPINKNIPTRVDVYGPPDRVFLLGTYGPAQLAKALGRYGTGILRESVKEVQRQQQEQRHPPTAPTSNDRKAIIAYLVKHTKAEATKTAKAAPQRATFLESMTIRLAELQRYAGQQIVRGPNGKIIGNISAGGGTGKGDRLASYHHDMAALQSKYATLLTEVPTIKTAHNAAVKAAEEALVAPAKSAGKTKKAASTQVKLAAAQQVELPKPIKYIPMSAFNPYQPIDVKLLLEGYGLDNLPQVLNTMTPNVLNKSAVAMATAQGLPLPANQKKETLIAYLMYHTADVGEPPPTKATKTAGKTAGQPRQPKKPVTIQDDGLVPIKIGINYNFNPLAPPDPSFLLSMYGEAQLEKALNRYSPARLKETIKLHLANAPKLKSKSTKAEIIAYIKQHTVSTPTEPQRTASLRIMALRVALLRRNFEYTTSAGVTHLVTTGTGGKWTNNQVVGTIAKPAKVAKVSSGKGPKSSKALTSYQLKWKMVSKSTNSAIPHEYSAFAHMTKIAGPSGSQEGQWYQDASGHAFYVKPAQSNAHAFNEVGAMHAYSILGATLGADIPHTSVLRDAAGRAYIVSQRLDGLVQHDGTWWQSPAGKATREEAAHLWAADVLLSHWDVVGTGHDNLLVNSEGHPVRIETGGAMAFRAQGAGKGSWRVGGAWPEAWTMRGIAHDNTPGGEQSKDVFGTISDKAAAARLQDIKGHAANMLADIKVSWEDLGMPSAQIEANLAVLQDRLQRIPQLRAELAPKTPSMPAAPSDATTFHWEGVAQTTLGGDSWGKSGSLDVQDGKATMTVQRANGEIHTYTVEADLAYGKYKAVDLQTGKIHHGITAKSATHFLENQIFAAKSAKGFKKLPGGVLFTPTMIPPAPLIQSAAQKALNVIQSKEEDAQASFKASAKKNGGTATVWVQNGAVVEYHHADGSMSSVRYDIARNAYAVMRFPANRDAKVSPAQSFSNHFLLATTNPHYNEQSYGDYSEVKTLKSVSLVEAWLKTYGVTSDTFTKTREITVKQAKQEAVAQQQLIDYNKNSKLKIIHGANPSYETPASYAVNLSGMGQVHITGKSDGITLSYKFPHSDPEVVRGLTPAEAKANLADRQIQAKVNHFVDMAASDYKKYLAPPTPAQEARIAAVAARTKELDARYGEYSHGAAQAEVLKVYAQYPEVRTALDSHLGGENHLSHETVKAQLQHNVLTPATRAKAGLAALRDVSEWSLLHQPNVTREGTIRLFHGSDAGKTDTPAVWAKRLKSAAQRRGTSMTDSWNIAENFAMQVGNGSRLVIAAQVPVGSILIWQGIRGDNQYYGESEYTLGTGAIKDYSIIDLGGAWVNI